MEDVELEEVTVTDSARQLPSFDEWVAAHGDALTRFALLIVGDRAGADDAVQEALSRAYPRWDRITRADDPLAYVRRMVVNAHISWWRSWRRRESPVERVDLGNPPPVPEPDDELWRHCLALPPRQRAAVVLRFYEGLSYAEVAAVLGITEVTARTQTHRALKTLRGALGGDDHD